MKKGTSVTAVARKIMGDVTIAAVEGVGGIKISEDDTIDKGKNDILSFKIVQEVITKYVGACTYVYIIRIIRVL